MQTSELSPFPNAILPEKRVQETESNDAREYSPVPQARPRSNNLHVAGFAFK